MALFHLSVTQTKQSAGQSAIASAAYRSGEKLYSEYYGEYSNYTRKGGVICSDILLPSHAPPEYADRQTLWNAVEKAERMFVRKSAKCDFFLNLMKKSLTFRLWRRCLKGLPQSLFPENNGPESPASPRPARPSGAHPTG